MSFKNGIIGHSLVLCLGVTLFFLVMAIIGLNTFFLELSGLPKGSGVVTGLADNSCTVDSVGWWPVGGELVPGVLGVTLLHSLGLGSIQLGRSSLSCFLDVLRF